MPSAVIGSGPIGFTDKEGKQQFIPLSQLYFNDDGEVTVKVGQLYNDNKKVVDALLKNLVAGGFLKSAPTLPPKPAIVIKAAIPGAKGNTIQVTFSNFHNIPTGQHPVNITTFNAEIIAKATYSNLNLDPSSASFIEKVLGVGATPGISPGLVRIKETAPAGTPIQPKPIETPTELVQPTPPVKKHFLVVEQEGSPSKPAFTLEAWKEGDDGKNIKITLIPDVGSTTKNFTLVVEWAQKILDLTPDNLVSKLAGEEGKEFVIKVSPPEGANSFGIPAPGTIVLSGGADARDAVPAEKVVFSR